LFDETSYLNKQYLKQQTLKVNNTGRDNRMNLQLNRQHAVVTGSTAGIGYAIADALAAEGATVTINGRTEQGVQRTLQRLRADHPNATLHGVVADAATAEGCAKLTAGAAIDILVNNMGIFEPKAFEDIPDEDWHRFFETNVMSGVRLSRAVLPGMKQRNRGRIVFISSESGICPPAEMVHYGMTKSAQLSIARGIAETCAGTGVTVNSVLPGPTLTEGAKDFLDKLAAEQGKSFDELVAWFFANARPTSLLRRFIDPKEVAAMVAYVCSPLSAATNGAALRVDGGVVRSLI
jgi:NAD(P)-dependent dehydrogenase (short-subunit alcohol dehydrogenase family)